MNSSNPVDPVADRQLNRYAEDFGTLFAELQSIRTKFDEAIQDARRTDESKRSLYALLNGMDDVAMVVTDSAGVIREASPAIRKLLAVTPESAVDTPLANLFAPSEQEFVDDLITMSEAPLERRTESPITVHLIAREGLALDIQLMRIPDPVDGYRLHWLLRPAEPLASDSGHQTEVLSELYLRSTNGIFVIDARGIILSVNPAFCRVMGYRDEDVVGQPADNVIASPRKEVFHQILRSTVPEEGEWEGDIELRYGNGDIGVQRLNLLSVRKSQDAITRYIAVLQPPADPVDRPEIVNEEAGHDPLTGLINRCLCRDRLEQAIQQAGWNNGCLALLLVDLDHFKSINDAFGHPAGDQLLMQVVERLTSRLRGKDFAARLGADEFAVVMPDLIDPADATTLADDIIRSVRAPFMIDGDELFVGLSVGIALLPNHADDGEELLEHAYAAMRSVKTAGGNGRCLYDDSLKQADAQRVTIESALRQAVAKQQFRLLYQPQISTTDGRITGVEALLRWELPGRGTVLPDQFIAIAEESGLILPIGAWVLRTACRQLKAWINDGLSPIRMAINVSARQLSDPDFADQVMTVLAETGTDPCHLEVEITESKLIGPLDAGLSNLAQLRSLGISVAVDDFGTGHSSLGRLRSLPIDRIKIDRCFVSDLSRNSESYAIARAIVAMASALRLKSIAEGVELEEQARLLTELHCQELQGYLFGAPQPPETIAAMLRQQKEMTATVKPKMLIVDDQPEIRKMLRMAMEPHQYRIVEAGDGETALALADAERPDVILLDVMMPGALDGFAVCRAIKDNPELARTFVVMLTAKGQPDDLAAGHVAGADAYMTKPCVLSQLVEVVEKRERSLKPIRIAAIQGH